MSIVITLYQTACRVFGPSAAAAQLEGSKVFMKVSVSFNSLLTVNILHKVS